MSIVLPESDKSLYLSLSIFCPPLHLFLAAFSFPLHNSPTALLIPSLPLSLSRYLSIYPSIHLPPPQRPFVCTSCVSHRILVKPHHLSSPSPFSPSFFIAPFTSLLHPPFHLLLHPPFHLPSPFPFHLPSSSPFSPPLSIPLFTSFSLPIFTFIFYLQ